MEKGQSGSGEAGEEEGQEAVAREGLCDSKFGEEPASVPDSGEKRFREGCLWLEIPQACLKVSIHTVRNEDVPVLAASRGRRIVKA